MSQAKTLSSSIRTVLAIFVLVSMAACASGKPSSKAEPASNGKYKIGQPYQIKGNWYYPREDYSYDETGIASWYGTEFNGTARTANGEIFNKDELTAAHKTLPLPTLARVTNLENGKSIVVRINDRGPFSGARIIDVSQRTAQLLDFESQGTAKVRVQVLADESRSIADAMRRYGSSSPPMGTTPAPSVDTYPPVASVTSEPLPPPQLSATQPAQPSTLANVKPEPIVRQLEVKGANQIYVQGGAYTSLENAKRMQQQLSKVSPASITEAIVRGTKFYRVRVGPVSNVPNADSMLDKVTRSGIKGARIIVE